MNDRRQRRLIVALAGVGIAILTLGLILVNRESLTPAITTTSRSSAPETTQTMPPSTTNAPTPTTISTPTTMLETSSTALSSTFALTQVSAGAVGAGDVATDSFPATPRPGSLLIAFLSYHSNEQVTPPSGWTFSGHGDGSGVDVMVYSRVAAGDESAVTFTLGTRTRWIVALVEVEASAEARVSAASTSGGSEVTSLRTGSVPAPPGVSWAVAAVTYDFDVAASGWSDGFAPVAGLGGGAANNQMHLEIGARIVDDSGPVSTSTSWSAAGRASSILIIYG